MPPVELPPDEPSDPLEEVPNLPFVPSQDPPPEPADPLEALMPLHPVQLTEYPPAPPPQPMLDAEGRQHFYGSTAQAGIGMIGSASNPPPPPAHEPLLVFFDASDLPPHLADAAAPFGKLAHQVVETLPRNAERTVCLRKLMEARDAAIRAVIAAHS